MNNQRPTHIAFADETHFNKGRYRAIALVTLLVKDLSSINNDLKGIFEESDIKEFKFEKLRNAKYRFAAIKLIEYCIAMALIGILRIDVLIWDTEDSRHRIRGRDDIANLHRMFYKVIKDILCKRWPDGSFWILSPDEHTAMKWARIGYFLESRSTQLVTYRNIFTNGKLRFRIKQEYWINEISPCKSIEEPLIQIADLFAGIAVFSRNCYDIYDFWEKKSNPQPTLMEINGGEKYSFSNSDNERCKVLKELDIKCKKNKIGVSLKKSAGLLTFGPNNPNRPINFWVYEPQHDEDKAPIKQ